MEAETKKHSCETLPLQPLPLEEPVVVHAVEVVCEGRHTQVVVDQSGKKQLTAFRCVIHQ